MDKFLSHDNDTARLIQSSAADLYERMKSIDVDSLMMPDHCKYYFKASHSTRLFFSIETSAHLLYRSIQMTGRKIQDIVIMDYGAGVGTLYLLAKMIGCKMVIYNDHLSDWKISAELIANSLGIKIDRYIVGDIDDCLDELHAENISCHIITSRNVIEHIYKLDKFYEAVYQRQPRAIVFSSTTANYYNPAAAIKHLLWHRKWEKVYRGMRLTVIQREASQLTEPKKLALAKATRGLAVKDLSAAISEFGTNEIFPDSSIHRSNTADPNNGVWAEHLLTKEEYKKIINEKNFDISFEAGFWDTHYSKGYKNAAGKLFNKIIASGGSLALRVAPFIYVIAKPKLSRA